MFGAANKSMPKPPPVRYFPYFQMLTKEEFFQLISLSCSIGKTI
tara:strand:+ start:599 stop:730 length:132 start_codon:yes stop_codon:yes gene_type:complete